jgi:penicillin-binding protein 2
MTRHYIRNNKFETRLFRSRVWSALAITGALFLILAARMFYLQVLQHTQYQTLSEKNRVTILPIAPNRGLIFDRNGVILADNQPSFSLNIIPEQTENLKATLDEIDALIGLSDEQRKRFDREKTRRRRFEGVPLVLNMTEEQSATIQVNKYRLPGVNVVGDLVRQYPQTSTFAHIIGYVGRINDQDLLNIDPAEYSASLYLGKTGIEKFYEKELHGTTGYQHIETDVRGRVVRILDTIEPIPGQNLYLTIDSELQKKIEEVMGETRGAVVAVDPSNGDILALVSNPSFDPNLFVTGIDHETYKNLSQDIDQRLFNRALRGQYPPASTVKPMFALQALETNTVNTSFAIHDPGYFSLPGQSHQYRDWVKGGHGSVNVYRAIVVSCDTFFYTVAWKMGIRKLADILHQFGFGSKTNVDISGEIGGLVATPEWKRAKYNQAWYPGETVITGIGQGYTLATPLQLAQMASILANAGPRFQMHVVNARELYNGEFVEQTGEALTPVYPGSKHWELVRNAMQDVTRGGTASYLSSAPYPIAGKTGTAQVFSLPQGAKYNHADVEEHLRDHTLFIGYAPADNPKIAIAIVAENEKGAGRKARALFDVYLGYNEDGTVTDSEHTVQQ